MNIIGIFLNPEIRTGGHRRYLEFFQSISDKGHNVSIILNRELDYNFSGIKIIRLAVSKNKKPYSIKFKKAIIENRPMIKNEVKNNDFVVIHGETHLFSGIYLKNIYQSKLLFAFRGNTIAVSKMKRAESEISNFNKLKLKLNELKYMFLEKIVNKNADIIAFQSNFDRDSFISRVKTSNKKVVIIPGNIGGDWFNKELEDKNKSTEITNLIFVGIMNKTKGIRYLIEAFILLAKKNAEITLSIIGGSIGTMEQDMKNLLIDSKLINRVTFHGKVNNPLDYIVKSDLVVVPSIFDSFPDVVLEALHVGTPVIASRVGGIPDMIPESYIFNTANSYDIYHMIQNFMTNNNLYMECKRKEYIFKEKFFFDWSDAFIKIMEDSTNV